MIVSLPYNLHYYFFGSVLMDLSKFFICTPYDFIIAKSGACGFEENILCYTYSYLKSRKQ